MLASRFATRMDNPQLQLDLGKIGSIYKIFATKQVLCQYIYRLIASINDRLPCLYS